MDSALPPPCLDPKSVYPHLEDMDEEQRYRDAENPEPDEGGHRHVDYVAGRQGQDPWLKESMSSSWESLPLAGKVHHFNYGPLRPAVIPGPWNIFEE